MKTVVFNPPTGGFVVGPTIATLRQAILEGGEDYWSQGSGDAGLHIEIDEQIITVVAHYHPQYGFCLVYDDGEQLPKVFLGDKSHTGRVNVRLSGNVMSIPSSYFVPSEAAFEIIEAFVCVRGLPFPDRWAVFDPEFVNNQVA
jgi:hypothetical protein